MTTTIDKRQKILERILQRPDLSLYLTHLTKSQGEKSAFQVITQILKSGKLLGSQGSYTTGTIHSGDSVICFTEATLPGLITLLEYEQKQDNPRFEPYGFIFTKETLYELGARPVIYLSKTEYAHIKDTPLAHLFVEFKPGKVDYTHEREWRLKGTEIELPPLEFVMVKTLGECGELENDFDLRHSEVEMDPWGGREIDLGPKHRYIAMDLIRPWL